MGLKEPVLRGIFGYGFKDPSPIQAKGILPVIQGKDTIAQVRLLLLTKNYQAQSGTGKTGAFAIGILELVDTDPASSTSDHLQALIVAPTRELSMQIAYVVHCIGEYANVKVHACIGGTSVRDDIRLLTQVGN